MGSAGDLSAGREEMRGSAAVEPLFARALMVSYHWPRGSWRFASAAEGDMGPHPRRARGLPDVVEREAQRGLLACFSAAGWEVGLEMREGRAWCGRVPAATDEGRRRSEY